MVKNFKSYLLYIGNCAAKSYVCAWDSANSLTGAVIFAVFMQMNGTLNIIEGTSKISEWGNNTLSLIIYTVGAWLILLILRMIFWAPYSLYRESKIKFDVIPSEQEKKIRKECIEKLRDLYKKGMKVPTNGYNNPAFNRWKNEVKEALNNDTDIFNFEAAGVALEPRSVINPLGEELGDKLGQLKNIIDKYSNAT